MKTKQARANILLLITAAIWGFAFVAQRVSMEYVGPFTFGGVRFLLGSLSLIPLMLILKRKKKTACEAAAREAAAAEHEAAAREAAAAEHEAAAREAAARGAAGRAREERLRLFRSAAAAGGCLFVATGFQQLGIFWTTAGNSGFITGVYVVLVPIAGIFFGRKTTVPTWIGAALTFAGLFLVSGGGRLSALNRGDVLVFVSGLFWTCHVLLIDHLVKKTDALSLSCGQFAVCGVLSLIAAACNIPALTGMGTPPEMFTAGFRAASLMEAAIPVLYGGLASVGIAYTLQVVAQQWAHPAHASIILVLESVFAAGGGILLLGEKPSAVILAGFCLMLSGMIVSQIRREAAA